MRVYVHALVCDVCRAAAGGPATSCRRTRQRLQMLSTMLVLLDVKMCLYVLPKNKQMAKKYKPRQAFCVLNSRWEEDRGGRA